MRAASHEITHPKSFKSSEIIFGSVDMIWGNDKRIYLEASLNKIGANASTETAPNDMVRNTFRKAPIEILLFTFATATAIIISVNIYFP